MVNQISTFQLSISMPNMTITEGRLLYLNVHYGYTFLEVIGDFQLDVPSFGLSIKYCQKVFALARHEDLSLVVRHGTISWQDCPALVNHRMLMRFDILEVLIQYYCSLIHSYFLV